MRTFRYFLRRLGGAVPTLFLIVTASFFLMRAAPGGPFDQEQALPPQVAANLKASYGLDQPLLIQYSRYLGALLHGDFGPSLRYRDFSVTDLISDGLPVTLTLGTWALGLALSLGILFGVFSALYRHSSIDHATLALTVGAIAIPSFVLLPFLGLVFGIRLHWLPVAGWQGGDARHLILPVLVLALPPLAYIARMTRAGMLDVLQRPYLRTAFAKGLPAHTVILRHALRPALLPVAGYLAPAVASIMTGSLVVESIGGLPGIGRYLVEGALNRDYTLVLGMVIVYSTVLIGMGLLVDVLYLWLDPRIRLEA
jgi:oligopeptide transport system permease protein